MPRTRIEKNIYFDSEKKLYYVKKYYGKNADGKYITNYETAKTKKEARRILVSFLHGKNTNAITLPSEYTVGTWLDHWMKIAIEPNAQQTTIYGYRQMMRNHIIPSLGNIKLQKLTADQLQSYYAEKMKILSPNTVLKHHNLLQTALNAAVKHDIIQKSPTYKVTPPKPIQSETTVLTALQLQKLIEAAYEKKNDNHALLLTIILIAFTGMRREEALGLTWGDVNFEKNIISIRRARTSAGNDIIIKKPKTSSSIRVISMPNRVRIELINSIVAQMKSVGRKPNASSFIIAKADGMPCRPNYMSMLFRELANELGFTHITLHGLRHTFASLANDQGYTMFDISKLLGHSRPDITAKIYTHLFETANQKMIEGISSSIEMGFPEGHNLLQKVMELGEKVEEYDGEVVERLKQSEREIEEMRKMEAELQEKLQKGKTEIELIKGKIEEKRKEKIKLQEEFDNIKYGDE